MNHPNSTLYNFAAKIVSVQGADTVTALVDCGFRNHSIRQFRLAGVSDIDPRKFPKGIDRDNAKSKASQFKKILEEVLAKHTVLLSTEKPTYAGNFSAYIFLTATGDGHYCLKHQGAKLFDVSTFMRDITSGVLAQDLALSFIKDAGLQSFNR